MATSVAHSPSSRDDDRALLTIQEEPHTQATHLVAGRRDTRVGQTSTLTSNLQAKHPRPAADHLTIHFDTTIGDNPDVPETEDVSRLNCAQSPPPTFNKYEGSSAPAATAALPLHQPAEDKPKGCLIEAAHARIQEIGRAHV
jgi:hypothetical protein